MKRTLGRTLVLAAFVLSPALAHAHEGEDHGAPKPAATSPGADGRRTAFGQTGEFELLLKFAPPGAGQDASILVFLSDYATNQPIERAAIELEFAASPAVKVKAEPAGSPGTYHAVARLPAGTYSVVATIDAGDRADLVEIKGVDLGPPEAAGANAEPGARVPWTPILIGAGALLVLAIVILLVRRKLASGRLPTAAAVLLLLALSPLIARGHGDEDHGKPDKKPTAARPGDGTYLSKESQFLLHVLTQVAAERDIEARIETVGRVVPRQDAHAELTAPQPGRILPIPGGKLPFLGDKVKKGQPLLVIEQALSATDTGEIQSQAIQARSALAQARARREQARRELDRRRSLRGVVAEKEIQQAELDLELASKDVELAEKQARLFGGGGLRRTTITSPIDGTIAAADVTIGSQVAADAKLYTILDPATLWVEADVFEADLGRIEEVGSANIKVEGYDQLFSGTLFRLGQLVDPASRTVKAIFAVANPKGQLRPGMFATVAIGAGARVKALAVPDAAVMEDGGRRFVFVHSAPELFVRKEIVLGARDGEFWAVRDGLRKGDRVVVQGTYQLRTSQ